MTLPLRNFDQDILNYLTTLPKIVVEELYGFPLPCLAVFWELPKLTQHYVLRTFFLEEGESVSQAAVAEWLSSKADFNEHTQTVNVLNSLSIWNEAESPLTDGSPGWILNSKFCHNLKVAFLGRRKSCTSPNDNSNQPMNTNELDLYARGRWEALVHYLTGKTQEVENGRIIPIFLHAGFIKREGDNNPPSITNDGLQFLLMETCGVSSSITSKRGMKMSECLAFLFSLSFGKLGENCSTEGFHDSIQLFIKDLEEFGLLYRHPPSGRFYPTKIGLNLLSRNPRTLDTEKYKLRIVVDENYRLYAYVQDSGADPHLDLVGMFTDFRLRLPNLVVGVISGDSVSKGLQRGMTAEQIITFLTEHAHEEMLGNNAIPPSVKDQIKLWEMEMTRVKFTDGVLYNQFLCQKDYEVVRDYAQGMGIVTYSSDQTKTVVVTKSLTEDDNY